MAGVVICSIRSWPERRRRECGGVGGEDEEGVGGAVLLGEAGLDGAGVGVEGGDGGEDGCGEEAWSAEEKKSAAEERELAGEAVHAGERGWSGARAQCKGGNAGQN